MTFQPSPAYDTILPKTKKARRAEFLKLCGMRSCRQALSSFFLPRNCPAVISLCMMASRISYSLSSKYGQFSHAAKHSEAQRPHGCTSNSEKSNRTGSLFGFPAYCLAVWRWISCSPGLIPLPSVSSARTLIPPSPI